MTVAELIDEELGWLPLVNAPMFVYGRDALVGEWAAGHGWKKVTIWEREWTRDDIIQRGATHWWPHLRDLPAPAAGPASAEPAAAAPSDIPAPPPGIALLSVDEFLNRAPSETPKLQRYTFEHVGDGYQFTTTEDGLWVMVSDVEQLRRELAEAQHRISALESMNSNMADTNISLAEQLAATAFKADPDIARLLAASSTSKERS